MSGGTGSRPNTQDTGEQGDAAQTGAQTQNARALAAALAAQAVGPIVVSPGSRSTPIVLACAEHPEIETVSVVDERSAGFFALGWARSTGRPAVLLCTSGSAAGHYLPAIMEADASELPLLIVTANRPIERESSGAPQTAVQRHLYAHTVRRSMEIDLDLNSARATRAVTRVTAQAAARTVAPLPGPVHLDVRIRKPLEPGDWPVSPRRAAVAPRWYPGSWTEDEDTIEDLAALVAEAERPLLVAGPAPRGALTGLRAARRLLDVGLPGFYEWTSQMRCAGEFWALGAGLQAERIREHLRPDLVLQLGMAPVTSGWEPWIENRVAAGTHHVVVQSGRMRDSRSTATTVMTGDPARVLTKLAASLDSEDGTQWASWMETLRRAHDFIVDVLGREGQASGLELQAARAALIENPGGVLGLGNSLAIRHAEGVPITADGAAVSIPAQTGWSWVWHQRGLSGIDGLISGMAGSLHAAAAEAGEPVPARLLLGDVSLVHDLGSLGLLQSAAAGRLDVVALDNGGGRIFERLPAHDLQLDEPTRQLFSTPPTVDFGKAVDAWDLHYLEVRELAALVAALQTRPESGARVIHVRCGGSEVTADHRRIVAALNEFR